MCYLFIALVIFDTSTNLMKFRSVLRLILPRKLYVLITHCDHSFEYHPNGDNSKSKLRRVEQTVVFSLYTQSPNGLAGLSFLWQYVSNNNFHTNQLFDEEHWYAWLYGHGIVVIRAIQIRVGKRCEGKHVPLFLTIWPFNKSSNLKSKLLNLGEKYKMMSGLFWKDW